MSDFDNPTFNEPFDNPIFQGGGVAPPTVVCADAGFVPQIINSNYIASPGSTPLVFDIPAGTWVGATITLEYSLPFGMINYGNAYVGIVGIGGSTLLGALFLVSAGTKTFANYGYPGSILPGSATIYTWVATDASSLPLNLLLTSACVTLTGTVEGAPVAFTVMPTLSTAPCMGGCNEITLTLLNSSGLPAPAGSGGQYFTPSSNTNGVSFFPNPVIVSPGQSSAIVDFCALNSGTYNVTFTPGSGGLGGLPAQTVSASVCGAATDSYITQGVTSGTCRVTRMALRDAILIELLGWCPFGSGQGNSGDLPTGRGFDWCNYMLFNQSIDETISDINVRSKFHTTINLSVAVAATTLIGPQFVPLQGMAGCATEQSINTIRRVVWYDSTGNGQASSPPLVPVSFQEEDRLGGTFDNYEPGIPNAFFTVGYQIGLLPGSVNGGSLSLYAGTSVTGFVADNDYIDQLPNDYLPAIVLGSAFRIARRNLDKQNVATMYPELKAAYIDAMQGINAWIAEENEGYQPSFGVSSSRWPGRKMPVVTKRRGSWSG